jgi:WbqC-like protein family
MKLAIMQPYFFPYIGYFQLINAVDKFIIYDHLNFIKKSWINHNKVLVINSGCMVITVPLKHKSPFIKISDIEIDDITKWREKLKRTLHFNYKKSLMYNEIYPILEDSIDYNTNKLSELNSYIITSICKYLKIHTKIECDSNKYQQLENFLLNRNCFSIDYKDIDSKIIRIVEICRQEQADTYYNAIGGVKLYPKDVFAKNKIDIKFIKTKFIEYKQINNNFIPNLSIIDVLMFNSIDRIHEMLNNFELL